MMLKIFFLIIIHSFSVFTYSINFLWIQDQQKESFNGQQENFIARLGETARLNPNADVTFWVHDVNNDDLEAFTKGLPSAPNLTVSHLNIVFSAMIFPEEILQKIYLFYAYPRIPHFFKIDLAKHLIADYVLSHKKVSQTSDLDYFVFSDLDYLETFTEENLFDVTTKQILAEQPFVPGSVNNFTENSFFIISTSHVDYGRFSKSGYDINKDIIQAVSRILTPPYISPQGLFGFYRGGLVSNECTQAKTVQFPDSHFFK